MRHVMSRVTRMGSIAATILSLMGCGAGPPVETGPPHPEPVVEAPPVAPAVAPPVGAAFEAHEIALRGDGRSLPVALAEGPAGLALFVREPAGVARYAIDVDARTATPVAITALDRSISAAAYDRARDRLWWSGAVDQRQISEPRRAPGFPRPPRNVTTSSVIAHSDDLRATIQICPAPASLAGGDVACDHVVHALLPVAGGAVLGGHLAERVGGASAAPWIGRVDEGGALTSAHRGPPAMGEAWVGALARSEAGVLAVVWSRTGEEARASLSLYEEATLDPIASARRSTPSWVGNPWAAAVAAPDGGFWVALTTTRHELTVMSIDRRGVITAEHAIEGAALPSSAVPAWALRGGEPWLMIASPYAKPRPTLWAGPVDPATGAVAAPREIALPERFYPSQMLATDRGFVLAGRVGTDRPVVVWVPVGDVAPR